MQIDPASTAMQLVAVERQNMDKLLKKQLDSVKAQQSAISSLTTKLSSFQTLLKDLNKASSLQAQKATLSQEGLITVTSNGKASSGQYSFFVEQLAQSHQVGLQLDSDTAPLPADGVFSLTVKGKTLDEAAGIKNTDIAEELALPPVKIHCSILAEDAIKAAIADYKQKKGL